MSQEFFEKLGEHIRVDSGWPHTNRYKYWSTNIDLIWSTYHMLSHFITDFFEYVYEQYLIHVNSVSTYLYHFNPFYTYSISICPGHPPAAPRCAPKCQRKSRSFCFWSHSELVQPVVHMAHGHGSALGLAFGLDGGKRSSFVKDCESIFWKRRNV